MPEKPETKQICFRCPVDILAWLLEKGEEERRALANTIVRILEIAKDAEKK